MIISLDSDVMAGRTRVPIQARKTSSHTVSRQSMRTISQCAERVRQPIFLTR